MTEMFGEAWSPMSVPDLAPDDDDDDDDLREEVIPEKWEDGSSVIFSFVIFCQCDIKCWFGAVIIFSSHADIAYFISFSSCHVF